MRKTFEDIIPPSRRQATARSKARGAQATQQTYSKSPRHFSYMPTVIALIVIGIVIAIFFALSSARVEIEPMTASANLSGTFTASASTTTPLPFAIISVKKVATQTVAGTGTETLHQAAHGIITIYNTRSVPQRLITKTRFETPSGLVFRIRDAVVVPASHGIVPGSVKATVYADTAGNQYNIAPSSFTLPGLAGTSLSDKVYAKSTSAMTGGFSGTRAKIAPKTEASARVALRKALAKSLILAIKAQVPSDYLLLSGAATTTYIDLPTLAVSKKGTADVKEQGITTAVVFPKSDFAKLVATNIVGSYSGQPVTLTETSGLTLIPVHGIPSSRSVIGNTSFNFALSGNTTVVWTVNKRRIASAVAGKTHKEAQTILKGFPEVKQANLILRPFWKDTFPNDPTKINIVVRTSKTDDANSI